MGLFNRRTTEHDVASGAFGTAAEPEIVGSLQCATTGCPRHDASACVYIDHRGRTCGIPACSDHREFVDDRPLCSLHAATVHAVGLNGNGANLPEVTNHVPFRVSWVARDLHDRVVALLQEHLRPHDEDRLLIDDIVRPMRTTDGTRRWEQAWKIVNHTGMPVKVSVSIEEGLPTEIVVRVGTDVVARATPPWFAQRHRAAETTWEYEDSQRRDFYEPIYQGVAEAVRAIRSAGVRGPY